MEEVDYCISCGEMQFTSSRHSVGDPVHASFNNQEVFVRGEKHLLFLLYAQTVKLSKTKF